MADFIAEALYELKPRLLQRHNSVPVVPESASAASLSFGTIAGGTNINSVPDRCTVTFDRRLVMGEQLEDARNEIRELLERRARMQSGLGYSYTERYATGPTWVSSDTPLVRAFAASIQEVLGRSPGYVCSPGPGEITQTHVVDESLAIDDLLTSIKVMALAAANLLGVD